MGKALMGLVAGVGLAWICAELITNQTLLYGQNSTSFRTHTQGGTMIALQAKAKDGEHVVLIDTEQRALNVYHVDSNTGSITLKSARSIRWDLLIEDFNATDPLPKEFRALVSQRR